jgi:hypothetical protein
MPEMAESLARHPNYSVRTAPLADAAINGLRAAEGSPEFLASLDALERLAPRAYPADPQLRRQFNTLIRRLSDLSETPAIREQAERILQKSVTNEHPMPKTAQELYLEARGVCIRNGLTRNGVVRAR